MPTPLPCPAPAPPQFRGVTFVTSRQGAGVTGGVPFGFDVGQPAGEAGGTLPGIDLGVRGMRVGGQRKLIVPPGLVRPPLFGCAVIYGERCGAVCGC